MADHPAGKSACKLSAEKGSLRLSHAANIFYTDNEDFVGFRMAINVWQKKGSTKTLAQGFGKRFDVQVFQDHTGQEREFYFFEQPNWSNVLALTEDDKVVMVRQFKQGSETITEEIPGGTANRESEDPKLVLERELLEETGYKAGRIWSLGKVWMNSRNSHAVGYMFLATECKFEKKPRPDESEELEVFTVPFSEFVRSIFGGKFEYQKEMPLVLFRSIKYLKIRLRLIVFMEWVRFFFSQ